MAKKHSDDTAKIAYRIKPPSVWRAIRAEWEAGAIPVDLARRFDVSASSVQARRDREGWSRDGMLERVLGARAAAPFFTAGPAFLAEASPIGMDGPSGEDGARRPEPGGPAAGQAAGGSGVGGAEAAPPLRKGVARPAPRPSGVAVADIDILAVHEVALLGALEALSRGRSAEAMALVHAGDVVGCFAEHVAVMRLEIAEAKAAAGGEAKGGAAAGDADDPPAA